MKGLSNKIISLAALLCATATNPSFAQSNIDTNIQALELSNHVKFKIVEFETNAVEIETNKSLMESQKMFDEKMNRMENSIKNAINTLKHTQANINRKQQAVLWFEILAAIDKYSNTNIPSVDISGYISPPPGYKGKVGLSGMLPPDTNDVVNYTYYVVAVKANKEKVRKAIYLGALQRINDWNANPSVEQFLKSYYTTSESDKAELNQILDQSKLSDSRKQKIRAMLP